MSAKRDFQSALVEYIELQQRKAVFDKALLHLESFLDTDATDAEDVIRAENCPVAVVPQDVIRSVVIEIRQVFLDDMDDRLMEIQGLEVSSGSEGKD